MVFYTRNIILLVSTTKKMHYSNEPWPKLLKRGYSMGGGGVISGIVQSLGLGLGFRVSTP